ncbi:hypothetical protein PV08_02689 [Exophiala spinifera]|uniref:UBC core domain-containing protein n=1 Tax=Exophiala spinifera TaxID=91928 RepID=A0A0D1YSY1_9EURO|nr:uncharacterized protein PV08_02689 [Exophiala spinifera]KIW18401.1 hypothetical protein PV08_02689 [Exophiala spinifera]
MRTLDIYDHVALKDDSRLCGTITRTNGDPGDLHMENELIIGHSTVSPDALNEFVTTSVPPVGHVFVRWAAEIHGGSLVDENDLILLSRSFQIGDVVKQDASGMTGTVIDVDENYTLEPIASCDVQVFKLLSLEPEIPSCTPACASRPPHPFFHPNPHALICNVPSREIKTAQDVVKGEYLTCNNWIGLVDDVEYLVVIGLENKSIVAVAGFHGIHRPIPDHGKPLITLPEFDGFRKPDFVVAKQGWSTMIPVGSLRPGEMVVADRSRLREGRWIRGSYDPKSSGHGVVLDVRARDVAMEWISNNKGGERSSSTAPIPRYEQMIYHNVDHFQDPASLIPNKNVTVYDFPKMPGKAPTVALNSRSPPEHQPDTRRVFPGQDFIVGAHVKFRDPTGAAVKYQGIDEDNSHGRLVKVVSRNFPDWDFNEFIVVNMTQKATVLWQDGSTTTSDSLNLQDHGLFEPELQPADIVLMREEMRQRPVGIRDGRNLKTSDFNEVALFERPHDLIPLKVGVIQIVEPRERVATVRWYQKPKIELWASGSILAPGSHFGPIGDTVTDVSLYEILSFPALNWRKKDMCILANSEEIMRRRQAYEAGQGVDAGRPRHTTSLRGAIERELAPLAPLPARTPATRARPIDAGPQDVDWVGQVVANGLDGSLTVRLGAAQNCRDVQTDPDGIIAVIDERDGVFDDGDMMDVDSSDEYDFGFDDWSDDSYVEPISESVEYEGGERLDHDEGDENWVSEEDDYFTDAEMEVRDAEDVQMNEPNSPPAGEETLNHPPHAPLSSVIPLEPPPQFLLLDEEPPSDQFGLHSPPSSLALLKRISKEHKILASSLPKGEIYVRTYESRLDLLRCLIIGPRDTPYENAPFLVDLHLPERFPESPPTAHFHSWTSGMGRINPNLYEEGKICLSLLGTWSGKHETESWSEKATILQVLVSLQGLVLVRNPFYNEAGFEGLENDAKYIHDAEQYSEKAFVIARRFVKHALLRPPKGVADILAWLYLPQNSEKPSERLLGTIVNQGKLLIERSESARARNDESLLDSQGGKDDATKVFLRPLSRGGVVMLRRVIEELQAELDKLKSLDGGAGEAHG